ncbi:hypothetical protein G9F72_019675 [Clostridium estertheticum]|uniref:hypothetical protein n=1 Tax=Clostridium estertheticum TaxID=238834 RepID=UPI0013E98008|nr:hypothetical protein [Clostridium estertheticum]MBZ9688552.1 hypothetical protein [Clostridium estertheticum]
MKVTKREQILLGALLLVLIAYGFYNFVYTKQNQKIVELKASKDTYSQKWEQVKAKIASKDKKNEQNTILNAKIFNETNKLFPSIKQEEIIMILDKMIKDSNLQADVLGFSEVSSESTTVPVDASKTANNQDKSKDATNELDKLVSAFNGNSKKDSNSEKANTSNDSTSSINSIVSGAYKMQVTLNFKGMYDELISFIEQVENYDKKIIINNINLTGATGSEVSGTLILEFYGVPKLNNNDYFKWDYKKPSGNGNPFLGSSSSLQVNNEIIPNNQENNQVNNQVKDVNGIIANKAEITIAKDEIKNDFVMTAKPITSNLHTVTIEKAKDESKQSYIYSDSEKIEPVEFYFTKVGSKYFYKYKTGIETYPKDFSNSIEFVPSGENIILDIATQKRGISSDLSGVNIKITNDTDKSLVVNILDDDKIKPRVEILKEKGDISVNRNYIYYTNK